MEELKRFWKFIAFANSVGQAEHALSYTSVCARVRPTMLIEFD